MPFILFNEITNNVKAATAKRQPTKNIGDEKFSAYCTVRNVPPQIMVIRIRASCGALLELREIGDISDQERLCNILHILQYSYVLCNILLIFSLLLIL
ncbi:hypothetical protein D3C76_1187260 [compost metagenome]